MEPFKVICFVIGVLLFGLLGCEKREVLIQYRMTTPPVEGDRYLNPAPTFFECPGCKTVKYLTRYGVSWDVQVQEKPILTLSADDIASAKIWEWAFLYQPEKHYFRLQFVPKHKAQEKFSKLQIGTTNEYLLVTIGGEIAVIEKASTHASQFILGGYFDTVEEAKAMAFKLGFIPTVHPFDKERFIAEKDFIAEKMSESMKFLAENPEEFRAIIEEYPSYQKDLCKTYSPEAAYYETLCEKEIKLPDQR